MGNLWGTYVSVVAMMMMMMIELTQEIWFVMRVKPKLTQYESATPNSRAEQLIATSGPRSRAWILISDCYHEHRNRNESTKLTMYIGTLHVINCRCQFSRS